jgi:glucokinase
MSNAGGCPPGAHDFVLAIDFGGTKIAVATAGLDGELLESLRLDTEAPRGATQAVERALASVRRLLARTGAVRDGRPLAVGAVSPGIVLEDTVLLAPNVPGWGELSLPALLRDGLELETVPVMTDVKAAALAEVRWGTLRGADPGVLLSVGTGVAAGVVIGGRVLGGARGAAGEIGYLLRGPGDEPAAAQGRAPLEEAVAGRAIGELGSRLLGRPMTAEEVFSSDDPRARALVDEAMAELAMHVANLAIVLDPARIAVGGGLVGSGHRILEPLRRQLSAAVPFPPELVPARFGQDGALRGAVALALDAVGQNGSTHMHDHAVKGEAR